MWRGWFERPARSSSIGLEHCRTQMEKKGPINNPPISESPDEVDNHAFDDPLVDHDPEQS